MRVALSDRCDDLVVCADAGWLSYKVATIVRAVACDQRNLQNFVSAKPRRRSYCLTLANAPDESALDGRVRIRSPSITGRNLHEPRLSTKSQGRHQSHVRLDHLPVGHSLTALMIAPIDAQRRHSATSSALSQPI